MAPSRITSVKVPLFSSDYARREREIAEWNRRARPSFASIEEEFNRIQELIDGISFAIPSAVGIATATKFGTVKTDLTSSDPVVYLKSTVDSLLTNLQGQFEQYVENILTPTNPVTITHGRSVRPSSVRVLTTPDYEEGYMYRTNDSTIGTTILTFGFNFGPGVVILEF